MNQNSREQMKYIEITEAGGPEVLKVVHKVTNLRLKKMKY